MNLEQNEQNEKNLGNTKDQGSSIHSLQHTYWCFTVNNYNFEQIEQIERIFSFESDWYIFQEETGELGTPHLQGIIKFNKRKRFSEVKKIITEAHWEPTRSVSKSIAYCSKEETRTGQQFTKNIELPEIIDVEEPYGWQLQVMDILKTKPDKRSIYWFWEPVGNVGKSTLCKYLGYKKNAILCSGNAKDIYNHILKQKSIKIVIIDIPRVSQDHISYAAIESIKNGFLYSGKYEGGQKIFNTPHIICFANQEPDYEKMSQDRWKVHRINQTWTNLIDNKESHEI